MKHDKHSPVTDSTQAPATTRRRFLGAGSALVPSVLTLVSQPALGVTCVSPSKALSQNASFNPNTYECNGVSPGNYKAQSDPNNKHGDSYNWPVEPVPGWPVEWSTYPGPFEFFKNWFNGAHGGVEGYPGAESYFGDRTLLQVLQLKGNEDPAKMGFHLVAAFENCYNGFVPTAILTPQQIVRWWGQFYAYGYVYVNGNTGPWWTPEQLKYYLSSNGISP